MRYIFPEKGPRNIGSTFYMNTTLQCLLHVSDLIIYFIDEFPKDQKNLININKHVPSNGDISRAFFNLILGVCGSENLTNSRKKMNPETNKKIRGFGGFWGGWGDSPNNNAFSPDDFKRTLGLHNPQFRQSESNNSKDLILYLLQTMHQELNYFGDKNQQSKFIPNRCDMFETYNHFITIYNSNNFSKISVIFYGTYKVSTICVKCRKILYNFQKFELISFAMYNYHKKRFNIYDGFKDNASIRQLTGENKFFCSVCNKLIEAETTCKIFEPPNKLLINIDYGKNNKYQPSSVVFDDIIDITQFVDFDYKQKIKYRILSVCTNFVSSGDKGHYVAFCINTKENKWYEFNDSSVSECSKNSIYRGNPYLLIYERILE
jgi:ubiquitin C-terminal hydrolase